MEKIENIINRGSIKLETSIHNTSISYITISFIPLDSRLIICACKFMNDHYIMMFAMIVENAMTVKKYIERAVDITLALNWLWILHQIVKKIVSTLVSKLILVKYNVFWGKPDRNPYYRHCTRNRLYFTVFFSNFLIFLDKTWHTLNCEILIYWSDRL